MDKEIKTVKEQSNYNCEKKIKKTSKKKHSLDGVDFKIESAIDASSDVFEQLAFAKENLEKYHQTLMDAKKDTLWPSSDVFEIESVKRSQTVHIDMLSALIEKSTITKSMLTNQNDYQAPDFVLSESEYSVSYDQQNHKILINPYIDMDEAIYGVIKMLRRGWHSCGGDILFPLNYEPEDAILINRILEADSIMMAVWVAWELKLMGYDGLWSYVLKSDDACIAHAFKEKAKTDFRSVNNGGAARQAFEAFFNAPTLKYIDRALIQSMLADEMGTMFDSQEPLMIITPTLIDYIGELPNGQNYMVGKGAKPLSESSYSYVEDRSNANFLWFVKFERSFLETEKKMALEERSIRQKQEKKQRRETQISHDESNVVYLFGN